MLQDIQKLVEIEDKALGNGAMCLRADQAPGETYLYVALCHKGSGPMPYIVWYYNDEDQGFFGGYYTDNKEDANKEFERRVAGAPKEKTR